MNDSFSWTVNWRSLFNVYAYSGIGIFLSILFSWYILANLLWAIHVLCDLLFIWDNSKYPFLIYVFLLVWYYFSCFISICWFKSHFLFQVANFIIFHSYSSFFMDSMSCLLCIFVVCFFVVLDGSRSSYWGSVFFLVQTFELRKSGGRFGCFQIFVFSFERLAEVLSFIFSFYNFSRGVCSNPAVACISIFDVFACASIWFNLVAFLTWALSHFLNFNN